MLVPTSPARPPTSPPAQGALGVTAKIPLVAGGKQTSTFLGVGINLVGHFAAE